jgi:prephenate dehydrogenase
VTAGTRLTGSVLIIGTGLVGTSVALALRRAGVNVLLEDVDRQHVSMAVERGAGSAWRDGEQPDVVVVACPPRHTARALADASRRFPAATLTDVTSVKGPILAEAVLHGADPQRLVGGHPMAGRELSGPAGARADLFDDRLWVVTPGTADVDHVMQVHRLVTSCGAYAVEMTAEDHDLAVALVSHAPQVLSSALAAQLVAAEDAHVRIAGQGLRDMTRIAASNVAMWSDILEVNGAPVADVLDQVAGSLQETAEALREGRTADIGDVLSAGVTGQSRIPGKHGAVAERYAEVTVQLADRSGELARMFVAAADAGVNVEDVRIEHVLGRPSGLVSLFVLPGSEEALSAALRAHNFDVRG